MFFFSYLEPDRDPWEPTEPTVSKRTQTEETSYTVQEREKNDRRPIDPTLESSQTSSAVQQREQKDRRYLTSDFTLELNNEEACCCDANRDFFMAMAKLTSKRSKDPNRQVYYDTLMHACQLQATNEGIRS